MGMHLGLIAVQATVEDFKEALLKCSPQLELAESNRDFQTVDEIWQWKDTHSEFVSSADWSLDNPGKSVYLLWQDEAWALLLDPEYVRCSDEKLLGALSEQFGRCLSFVVESAGGCAMFWCFENGVMQRMIAYTDGQAELQGQPLAEEEGIDVNNYYMDETEALWQAFGIHARKCLEESTDCLAISVIDRTDYSYLD